jgi:glycosyltransferase involved in cell wall biosynthesis
MRVAFIIDGPLDQVSGGYLYDARLVETLRNSGHRVEIVSLPQGSYLRRMAGPFPPGLLDRLQAYAADVIVEDELSHPGLLALNARLRLRSRAPIISLVHHLRCSEPAPRLLRSVYALVERRYLRGVDGFIFNSQATRRVVQAMVGAGQPAVVASPAGDRFQSRLTEGDIRRRAHAPGPLRLLFLGNLVRRKGLITLLEALAAKPAPSAVLAVAGDGRFEPSFAAAVKRRAERLGLARRVEWLGPLYDSVLAERLAASQVLAVPSMYEGFGIAYLEGMAFGLPAIGGTDGGASEVIRDGENGFLVRPGEVAALADRLRLLADDRVRLESLSIKALQTFRIHPTWSQTGETIRRFLYEQTISPGAAAHLTLKEETA